jgi:hypothetical protein
MFWHDLWGQAGKPREGWIATIRRVTRAKYHKAIKNVRKEENDLRRQRMAEHIAQNNTRDLWRELRKLKPDCNITSSVVDGKNDKQEVANIFKEKYESLFSSVPTPVEELEKIKNDINQKVNQNDICNVTVQNVKDAIEKLNYGKSDGNIGFTTDHLIHSSHMCKIYITLLLNCMLVHGYNPEVFLESNIVSIPKHSKGDLCTSDNYRGISLNNALTKVLDLVIIEKHHDAFNSSNMQYGFKKQHSTVMCSVIFKEVVQYYLDHKTNVYCCFLDATKAFDRVHIGKLFKNLLSRDLPGVVLRLLYDVYNRQIVHANWQDVKSEPFHVLNGVRQGAIMSPLLFCLYIDMLLQKLKDNGIGCHIGNFYYGALGYADDVVLLCPTRKGLQQMIDTCETVGREYSILYNTKKTVTMVMTPEKDYACPNLSLYGNNLEYVKSFKYLGINITPDLRDDTDINVKRGQFISSVNTLMASFRKLNCKMLNQLFDTYCCSFYGCQTWLVENKQLYKMRTAYNKALRRIWQLPNTAHTNVTLEIASKADFNQVLDKRILSLYLSMCNSDNPHVSYMANVICKNKTSRTGINLDIICKRNGIFDGKLKEWLSLCKKQVCKASVDGYHVYMARMINELILCKENDMILDSFTTNEIQILIDWLATM